MTCFFVISIILVKLPDLESEAAEELIGLALSASDLFSEDSIKNLQEPPASAISVESGQRFGWGMATRRSAQSTSPFPLRSERQVRRFVCCCWLPKNTFCRRPPFWGSWGTRWPRRWVLMPELKTFRCGGRAEVRGRAVAAASEWVHFRRGKSSSWTNC